MKDITNAAVEAAYERGRREERRAVVDFLVTLSADMGATGLMVDHIYATAAREFADKIRGMGN
jgi:hypothetical protein